MISNNRLKFINSLQTKKYRQQHQSFLVEGAKNVAELLQSDFEITSLYVTTAFETAHRDLLSSHTSYLELVTEAELQRAGTLQTNNAAIAIARTKRNAVLYASKNEFVLALDAIRDPGNLGTIIRIADWYGISKIICSDDTADVYNPKVIAASMGSFTRVSLYYCKLTEYLSTCKNLPIYGAFLEGKNVHNTPFEASGIILMGNESQGISDGAGQAVTHKISIPRYGGAESLNVAIATAVICDNMRKSKAN